MKALKTGYGIHSWLLMVLLCLILCAAVLVGVTQARYTEEIKKQEISLQARTNTLQITAGDWALRTDGSYQAEITLKDPQAGTAEEAFAYSIRCLASLGIGSADNVTVTLDGIPAEAEQIGEGTLAYDAFGAGWVFRFSDEEGQELAWKLTETTKELTKFLTVTPAEGTTISEALVVKIEVIRQN